MTQENQTPNVEDTSVQVSPQTGQVSAETEALVKEQMPHESDDIQRQTMQLVEALRTRAMSDAHSAGDYTRERYLAFVKEARETLENEKLFDPERIEYSAKLLQYEVEKNWDSFQKQIQELGDRISEAATAAWNVLTSPRDPNV